ncbi:hypothetical protein ACIOKD_04150 [Streptomyces sp. NPDC087844]|uniref:hypothetical protein n=1 Tax=Streptomyces sp. NPDC087844 TaxID=3365805 RepID=UPI003823F861
MPFAVRALCHASVTVLGVAPVPVTDDDWSVVPSAGGGHDGRPYFYAEGAPGMVLQDTGSVRNPGGKPLAVRLGGADADNGADKALSWPDPPDPPDPHDPPDPPALDGVDVELTVTAEGGARGDAAAEAWFVPRTAASAGALSGLAVCAGGALWFVRRVRRMRCMRRVRPRTEVATEVESTGAVM